MCMSDNDLERMISKIVLDLMMEAYEQGHSLSYRDICKMVGIPEEDILDDSGDDAFFTISDEFVDAVENKEMREAMIERAFSTIR